MAPKSALYRQSRQVTRNSPMISLPSEAQTTTPMRRHSPMSVGVDRELITRIVAGNPDAQEEFVTRFRRLIMAVLSRVNLPRQEREDLAQQVFVHLWEQNYRRLRSWNGSHGKFCSFLGTVVTHLARDYRRRSATRPSNVGLESLPEPAIDPDYDALLLMRQRRQAITRTLSNLRPRDASLIVYRHFHEQTYREIAATLGMEANGIGVALLRAEQRLRKRLCQDYPDLFAQCSTLYHRTEIDGKG